MPTFSEQVRTRLHDLVSSRGSYRALERAIGRGNRWLSRKMSGERGLTLRDVDEVLEHLDVEADDFMTNTNTNTSEDNR